MWFRQVFRDSVYLVNNKSVYEFFKDVNETQESISSLIEKEAVRWLFGGNGFLDFFCIDFFEKPGKVKSYFSVSDPFIKRNEKPGDLDLVLIDPEEPHKSIAFECKRIKVQTLANQQTKINGLGNLESGIFQVNNYLKLGFHQTYLMIIILDDCRYDESENVMLRSSRFTKENVNYNFKWPKPLKNSIGVVYVRITQQTKRHYSFMCGFGVNIPKLAVKLQQANDITKKVEFLLKNNSF
ncbi:MAG: hypothetical protein IPM34_05480 [Saprospiraceae bacterium]|nr:hypothetical protein [Saprospiraceae bacterium]MBV6474146.1 hypothetical protein [Saprospiraceae bacterium]